MIELETRAAGHFGELLQGRLGAEGPVVLITLPCPALAVTAKLNGSKDFEVINQHQQLLDTDRAKKFLSVLNVRAKGVVQLQANMPVGGGGGASTAALVALANIFDVKSTPGKIADACIQVEGASDPLMFPSPETLLWASRKGKVLGEYGQLPSFDIIGGFYGPPRRTDAYDLDFPDISDLVLEWKTAVQSKSLETIAKIASESAQRTLALRGYGADPTGQLAKNSGAKGYCIAHTGSARGLIFPKGKIPSGMKNILIDAGFQNIIEFSLGNDK